jgi:hypothetical protein
MYLFKCITNSSLQKRKKSRFKLLCFYFGNSDALTASFHDLSVNHLGAGFRCRLFNPTPPVRKNVNNLSSNSPCDKYKNTR